jgi:hypothetical protein
VALPLAATPAKRLKIVGNRQRITKTQMQKPNEIKESNSNENKSTSQK